MNIRQHVDPHTSITKPSLFWFTENRSTYWRCYYTRYLNERPYWPKLASKNINIDNNAQITLKNTLVGNLREFPCKSGYYLFRRNETILTENILTTSHRYRHLLPYTANISNNRGVDKTPGRWVYNLISNEFFLKLNSNKRQTNLIRPRICPLKNLFEWSSSRVEYCADNSMV